MLGDDPKHPTYIETVHRRGYIFIAPTTDADAKKPEVLDRDNTTKSLTPAPALELKPTTATSSTQTEPPKRPRTVVVASYLTLALTLSGLLWNMFQPNSDLQTAQTSDMNHLTLAVLPFEQGPEIDRYLSEGMAQELIVALHRNAELRIINSTDAFRFKGSDKSLKEIGSLLGVSRVLSGSIRRVNGILTVTANLVSSSDGFNEWTQTFDVDVNNLPAVQSDIATALIRALGIEPTTSRQVLNFGTEDPVAYRLALQGFQNFQAGNPEAMAKAVEYFEQVLAIDPSYFKVYNPLLTAYLTMDLHLGGKDYQAKILPLVEQAKSLNADKNTLRKLRHTVALVNQDLFEIVRISSEEVSQDILGEWDPLLGFVGPRTHLAMLLSIAGYHQDAISYYRALQKNSGPKDHSLFEKRIMENMIAQKRYQEVADRLSQCSTDSTETLGHWGCGRILFRMSMILKNSAATENAIGLVVNQNVRRYFTAIYKNDLEYLRQDANKWDPKSWLNYFITRISAHRYDEAFTFWRTRFPSFSMNFQWDSVMRIARENPRLLELPAYKELMLQYGVTDPWRAHLCESVRELQSVTGIEPVCELPKIEIKS